MLTSLAVCYNTHTHTHTHTHTDTLPTHDFMQTMKWLKLQHLGFGRVLRGLLYGESRGQISSTILLTMKWSIILCFNISSDRKQFFKAKTLLGLLYEYFLIMSQNLPPICPGLTLHYMISFKYVNTPREQGMNWEIGTAIYALLWIKQITNKNRLYSTGNFNQRSMVT